MAKSGGPVFFFDTRKPWNDLVWGRELEAAMNDAANSIRALAGERHGAWLALGRNSLARARWNLRGRRRTTDFFFIRPPAQLQQQFPQQTGRRTSLECRRGSLADYALSGRVPGFEAVSGSSNL